jgi:iron complex transport system ATP-binding protein
MLEARIPSFSYRGPTVLREIEIRAPEAGLLALVGPNGSGKSTLLRILAGLLPCPQADVRILGRSLAELRPRRMAELVAWVPQRAEEAEGMTVREMVRVGRYRVEEPLRPLPEAEEERITSTLAQAGLGPLADRDAGTLSGGEYQRALLARAMVQATPLLLLDEPIASLDLRFQEEVYARLRELARSGRLVLVADHHIELAADHADRLLLLHEGRIAAEGVPREVLTGKRILEVFGVDRVVFSDPVSGSPRLARPGPARPGAEPRDPR